MSTLPSVSAQISSAVVLRCTSGWPVLELHRHKLLGCILSSCSALLMGAHALGRGRQHHIGAQRLEQPAALDAHALGHRSDQPVPPGAQTNASAMPGVAAGRARR